MHVFFQLTAFGLLFHPTRCRCGKALVLDRKRLSSSCSLYNCMWNWNCSICSCSELQPNRASKACGMKTWSGSSVFKAWFQFCPVMRNKAQVQPAHTVHCIVGLWGPVQEAGVCLFLCVRVCLDGRGLRPVQQSSWWLPPSPFPSFYYWKTELGSVGRRWRRWRWKLCLVSRQHPTWQLTVGKTCLGPSCAFPSPWHAVYWWDHTQRRSICLISIQCQSSAEPYTTVSSKRAWLCKAYLPKLVYQQGLGDIPHGWCVQFHHSEWADWRCITLSNTLLLNCSKPVPIGSCALPAVFSFIG